MPEYLLILPFSPRGKDNLIGWMAARCDGDNLGKLVFYQLPKQQLMYGPMQIESRIDQDQNISKDLTLWNQQGSRRIARQHHRPSSVRWIPLSRIHLYSGDRSPDAPAKKGSTGHGRPADLPRHLRPSLSGPDGSPNVDRSFSRYCCGPFKSAISNLAGGAPSAAPRSSRTAYAGAGQATKRRSQELDFKVTKITSRSIFELRTLDLAGVTRGRC